jgi:hypothetical protein
MRVLVFSCDKTQWALRPCSYLFNQHWSALQEVVVSGFRRPPFPLPGNWKFMQIAQANYPPEKWTDQVMETLSQIDDDWVVAFMDDYWLKRTVDCEAVRSLYEYVRGAEDVLRVDLTDDRQYAGRARDIGAWGRLDLVETDWDTPYQLSTQAALLHRRHWLSILRPGMSPWEYELQLQDMVKEKFRHLRVLGTRQSPVRYVNGLGMGHGDKGWTEGLDPVVVQDMRKWGWFPK